MKVWGGGLLLAVGIVLGAAGAIMGPRLAAPYLPAGLRAPAEVVDGEVTRKQREADRLMLTVVTPRGAILATFKNKVPEIDLLVAEGDTLTLSLSRFEPFVDDPAIEAVKKKPPATEASPTIPRTQ